MKSESGATPKVTAGAAAGAFTVILVWGLRQFAKIEIPGEVASALTLLLSTVAGYFAPRSEPTIDQIKDIKANIL